MAETPTLDYGSIEQETGPTTASSFQSLWFWVQNGIIDEARNVQIAKDILEPKVLVVSAAASVDNLDLKGSSVVHFTGASGQNFTGMIAPAPNKARVVIVHVSGAGTITLKHNVTSTSTNRLSLITGADTALATGVSAIFIYLSGLWRQLV
jgi:hypothetical protein